MRFLNRQVLLTKDNLATQNWAGSLKCCFCDSDESVQHFFSLARLRVLFVASFSVPLICLHRHRLLTCLAIGLMVWIQILKLRFGWEFRHSVGLFEIAKMMLFLIDQELRTFCMLSTKLLTGFVFGLFCFLRICWNLWILDATSWRWYLGISLTGWLAA